MNKKLIFILGFIFILNILPVEAKIENVSLSQSIGIRAVFNVNIVPTVQIELSGINVFDLSEYKPKLEIKKIKLYCNETEEKMEILKVNNFNYEIICEEKDILINLIGKPKDYPFDVYVAEIEISKGLDLTPLKEKIEYESEKHNFLELNLDEQNGSFVLKLQRKAEEKSRVLLGLIFSSIFLTIIAIINMFSEKKGTIGTFKFILEILLGIFLLGSFLNSFARFKITTFSFFYLLLYSVVILIVLYFIKRHKKQISKIRVYLLKAHEKIKNKELKVDDLVELLRKK